MGGTESLLVWGRWWWRARTWFDFLFVLTTMDDCMTVTGRINGRVEGSVPGTSLIRGNTSRGKTFPVAR